MPLASRQTEHEWDQIDLSAKSRRSRRYCRLPRDGESVARAALLDTAAHFRGLLRTEAGIS